MNAAPSASRVEIAFVFDNLPDWQRLVTAARNEGREVAVLSGAEDGLAQMAAYLQGRSGVDAIHVLSHGAQGTVQAGSTWLSSANLAEHQAELQSIGAALKADGDLMLYGCKVGESEQGQAFLDELASITGADVAASADNTGAAILGGNWTLERSVGSIETTALGAQLEGYTAVMAAQFTGGADANAPVLGTGALSRMVVGDFNGDGRDDILFQTSNTVNAPWKFAAGKVGGGFTIVDRTDITSPFRNIVSMVDMANTGSNYYAADFDNDGDIDLLGVTVTFGPAYLYRNNNGVFESTTPTGFGGAQFGSRLVVGDFNGDGAADILYEPGTVDNLNSWRYALNNGNGTFTDVTQSASPFASFALPTYSNFNYRVIDFEGDGDLDIIYMVAANPASLFLNNGNATFALGAGGNIPIATFSQRAIFGDFDGDGDADMFWQIGTNGTDWNYAENLNNGTFAPTVTRANSPFKGLQMVDFGTTNFRIGDFDGDGDTDLLGSSAGVGASVYYQDGTSPKLLSTTPADESGAVSPSANIVLKFDQTVLKGSGNIKIVRTSDNQVIQTIDVTSGAVTGSGDTWTINPPADLVGGVAYAMRIDSKAFVSTSSKIYAGIQTNTELNFVTSNIASPVISGLDGDSISYTEKGAPVLIDPTGNAVVTDADSLNFSGGTLTVTINSGRVNSEDVLGVMHEGTGAGQIGVSGGLISYNNITVGIASGGTGSNPLVINFNSLATPTVLSALLHRLTYSNSNTTDIGTGARNIQVTLADGTGGVSNVANISLAITAVNDAPTATTTASDPTFTEGGSAVTLFSSTAISPVEASQRIDQIVFRVLNVGNGSSERLRIDGTDVFLSNGNSVNTVTNSLPIAVTYASGTADVTISSAAGLTAAAANSIVNGMTYANDSKAPIGSSRSVVLVSVRDNGGGSNTTNVGTTSAVTLVAVNDAPTLAGGGGSLTWTEGNNTTSTPVVVDGGLTITDADGPYIASATARISNNYSNGNDYLELVSVPATMGNVIGTWDVSTGTLTMTSAGNQASLAQFQAALQAVTFTNLSDSPSLGARTVEFRSNDGSLDSAGVTRTITMSAVDDTPLISVPASTQVVEDVASVINLISISDPDSVNVYMTLNVGSGTLGAISGAGVVVGGNATTMNLSGTIAAVNAFIANNRVTYTTAANATADVTLTIAVDTGSVGTDTKTVTLAVTPVNDAPVATVPVSLTVTEDVPGGVTGISFSDVDAGSGSVTVTFSVPSGTLSAVSGSGVTVGDSGTATLTMSGTLSDINAFIAASSVKYQTALDHTSSVLLTVSINDNGNTGGNALTDTKTVTLNVTAVNDAPVNSVPGSQTIGQDNPLVFNSAKGNLISVSDIDVGSGTVEVTLSAANGLLTLSTTTGLNFTSGDGSADATMTFSGTLSAVNDALNGLIFTPATGYSGPATITLTTNDSGGTGSGGALSDTDVIAITVSPPPEPEPVKPTEPTKPAVPVPVDGALVSTQTAADGSTITTITPVTADRTDDPNTPNADLADIPLIIAPNGQPIVQVGLPVGVGLQSQGQAHALNGGAALTELALRIQAVNGNAQLLSNGQSFMEGVDASTPLHVQTITVSTGTGFNPAVPLVISGSRLPQEGKQAIVLDARALPSGSVIQVDHIDFIAVVGNVRLIGGSGQNMAAGDDGAQWIVLGADDDVLHGGGGNDTVGSLGGNDQVFGDAGDDIVFGGTGHDTLSGGTGSDRLDGGIGWDTALQIGSVADYTLRTEGQFLVMTHKTTGEVDRLKSIETVQFDSGANLYIADSNAEAALAHIVTTWLGRDLTPAEGAWAQQHSGLSDLQVAQVLLNVSYAPELQGHTAEELVAGWLSNPQIVRMDVASEHLQGTAELDQMHIGLNLAELSLERTGSDRWEGTSRIDGNMAEFLGIERLHLKDVSVALDTHGTAGQLAALLSVTLGSSALDNKGLVGEGLAALDAGMSVQAVGNIALSLAQAQQGHPFAAQETVQWLWTKATGTAGTEQQLQPLVQQLRSGQIGSSDLVNAAVQHALAHPSLQLMGVLDTGLLYTAVA